MGTSRQSPARRKKLILKILIGLFLVWVAVVLFGWTSNHHIR